MGLNITFIFLEYGLTYSPITDPSSPPPDFQLVSGPIALQYSCSRDVLKSSNFQKLNFLITKKFNPHFCTFDGLNYLIIREFNPQKMYFWLLTRVELSDNQKVQKFSLNFLIIRKFNPCVVELSEVELSDYIRHNVISQIKKV